MTTPHCLIAVFMGAIILSPIHAIAADATKSPGENGLKTISLFDGKTLDGWLQVPENSWVV